MIYRITIIFVIIISICSFNKRVRDNYELINIQIDNIISNSPIKYSDLFSDFQIVPLETNRNCTFNFIDNIKLINDTLFIFDRRQTKSLYLFSKEGKILSKISKIGRGPGEYITPVDFDVDRKEKSVFIFDWSSRTLNVYDYNGNYLRNIPFKNGFQSFVLNNNCVYFYMPPHIANSSKSKLIYQFDLKGKEISNYIKYSEVKEGPHMIDLFKGGNFFNSNNDIKFFKSYCDTIFSIDNRTIRPFIIINTKNYRLTDTELSEIKKTKMPVELTDINKLHKIFEYSENNNLAFFKMGIGKNTYYIFYNFKTKNILCSNRIVDDLTFTYPRLFRLNENKMIGILDPSMILKIKSEINNGKINLSEANKAKFLDISEFNNPIIILLEVKKI